ncbi:MAG: hypothetical protein ACU0BS_00670 [Hasllibacter sp.]
MGGLAVLVARWEANRAEWLALSYAPGGGDFDLPEQLALEEANAALEDRIAAAVPETAEDAAAQLRWYLADSSDGEVVSPTYAAALRNCIEGLRRIGGAA